MGKGFGVFEEILSLSIHVEINPELVNGAETKSMENRVQGYLAKIKHYLRRENSSNKKLSNHLTTDRRLGSTAAELTVKY